MNNDRFKFRAWDKEKKRMFDWEDVKQFSFGEVFEDGDCIPLPCIGLKDIDGKLIYEGDIITSDNSYNLEVFWMGLAWGVRWKDGDNKEDCIICDDGGDMEMDESGKLLHIRIIGNKFTNPELLEGK